MANLIRYGGFEDMVNDFFKGFLVRPLGAEMPGELQIKIDVDETPDAYVVHADLPGVKKQDIAVTVEDNVLTIRAEVKRETERKEGERVVHSERYQGTVSRSFRLTTAVDRDQCEAKFVDGVLQLRLPKRASATSRQLTIN